MKAINVSEATNAQLNWLVAKCEGEVDETEPYPRHSYSTDWEQMGPIIEREGINLSAFYKTRSDEWQAWPEHGQSMYGKTPLIACARCFVASKIGNTVEVPEELA